MTIGVVLFTIWAFAVCLLAAVSGYGWWLERKHPSIEDDK